MPEALEQDKGWEVNRERLYLCEVLTGRLKGRWLTLSESGSWQRPLRCQFFLDQPKVFEGSSLKLCTRKYAEGTSFLLSPLKEARPPGCPSLEAKQSKPQVPSPPDAGSQFVWGPVPAATQCYLFRSAATSGHTWTANSCFFFCLPTDWDPSVKKLELPSPENSQRRPRVLRRARSDTTPGAARQSSEGVWG